MNQTKKSLNNNKKKGTALPLILVPVSFFLVELAGWLFLKEGADAPWPLAFGVLWALVLTGIIRGLPEKAGRILYGISYFLFAAYTIVQTGYYHLFGSMMWVSEFLYVSEGSAFFSVLLQYPISWWLCVVGLLGMGVLVLWKFPRWQTDWLQSTVCVLAACCAVCGCVLLPQAVFVHDRQIQYAGSDYGRAQSAEAAYTNMFDTHRLYQVCGVYQTVSKDIYTNLIYPITPGYAAAQAQARGEIDAYFAQRDPVQPNAMTGIFEGKNVVLVLMESMDDFALGEHTPTINRLMEEGINFTDFYTPVYGSVRTFNSEFCTNTGSFLSSQGGYAFDYVTNDYRQSLASRLMDQGYSAKVYHYNDPSFYSRGVFSPAMGYEEYVCYADYVTEENEKDLYDDQLLFDNGAIRDSFFRDGKTLNFIITRSAHLSYKYNEVLSYWALKKYPQYRGLTGHEETDCMYLKAKLVDDMFARLLQELEAERQLEDTVIVAVTDHYAYGYKDVEEMMALSGVEHELLLEKTPCFIWSADKLAMEVNKTLNTSDLLPTVLNLLGVESPYSYIGRDAFDDRYPGYALFTDGSWVSNGAAYSAATDEILILADGRAVTEDEANHMAQRLSEFVYINNLILETDYYKQ